MMIQILSAIVLHTGIMVGQASVRALACMIPEVPFEQALPSSNLAKSTEDPTGQSQLQLDRIRLAKVHPSKRNNVELMRNGMMIFMELGRLTT